MPSDFLPPSTNIHSIKESHQLHGLIFYPRCYPTQEVVHVASILGQSSIMLSIKTILALAVSLSLASGTAIPTEQSLANPLEKRADLSCPGSNNSIYTGPRGGRWRIYRDRDCPNQPYKITNYISFQDCINSCGADPNSCNDVNFTGDMSSGTCYLKKSCGGTQAKDGVMTAVKQN